jgi:transcriptional regulator with XRE-family HTH domain
MVKLRQLSSAALTEKEIVQASKVAQATVNGWFHGLHNPAPPTRAVLRRITKRAGIEIFEDDWEREAK